MDDIVNNLSRAVVVRQLVIARASTQLGRKADNIHVVNSLRRMETKITRKVTTRTTRLS